MKKALAAICLLLLASVWTPMPAAADVPYASYFFNADGYVLPVPAPYEPAETISHYQYPEIGALNNPQDLYIDAEDRLYIADTGNNRVVVIDQRAQRAFAFGQPGEAPSAGDLATPHGVYAHTDGTIYVADSGNRRIALFDRNGAFLRAHETPESSLLGESFKYHPVKIAVDFRDYMYVVSQGNLRGLMMLDSGGQFRGFVGANRAEAGPLDMLLRLFYSREARSRVAVNLPYSFNNVTISPAGFMYVTTTGQTKNQVRKLNAVGSDIMPNPDFDYSDRTFWYDNRRQSFIDSTVDQYGNMTIIDQTFGRLYQYDESGRMLFAFGSTGVGKGLFGSPSALAVDSAGTMYVLDQLRGHVQTFRPTPFAELVHQANYLYSQGQYEDSLEPWQEVRKLNSYYELALQASGHAELRREQYELAMDYFKRAYDQVGYSKAYHEYRRLAVRDNFGYFASGAVGVSLLAFVAVRLIGRRRGARRERERSGAIAAVMAVFRRAFWVMTHPVQGFEALRYEGKGRVRDGVALMLAYTAVSVASRLATHFMYERGPLEFVNWPVFVIECIWPWLLWSVVHYGISTITDGEGRFRDVLTGAAYCLTPFIFFMLPLTLLTHVLTLEERNFYDLFQLALYAWSGFLLFVKIKETHSYNFMPSLFIMLASLIGCAIAIGLLMLLYGMGLTVIGFVTQIVREVLFIGA